MKRPVYQSLASHISHAIAAGTLQPGDRLPTHRWLADRLEISVQTVSRAYDALIRRGEVVGEVGRGSFVRPARGEPVHPFIAERREGELIDLSMLKPVSGPQQTDAMQRALAELQANLPQPLLHSFRPNVVLRAHRDQAVAWLALCGLTASPDNIHITNGATPAMTMALMTALRPGELLVTEAIGHHTLTALARYLGFKLAGLAIDREGLLPDAFEAACREQEVKAVFLVPTVANPTVALMGPERRHAIVEIARRHDVAIIENEAWGPLVEHRPPPFAALAPERSYHISSFTKCVLPGLRVGYLVVPNRVSASVANRHLVTNWIATPIVSEIASRWIGDGTARELMLWQRDALRHRQAVVAERLRGIDHRGHPESLHIWLPLPPAWDEEAFVAHARLRGVAVAPGSTFAMTGEGVHLKATPPSGASVRVCIGAAGEAELERGLDVIAALVRSEPEPALLTI